ncbi:MAG: gephyrin-like molybdotransferase Glp [Pseudomonadota bacterium]
MIDLDAARAAIVARTGWAAAPVEQVPLAAALGRVLAFDTPAPRAIPGFAHAAMDGYALRGADLDPSATTRLRLRGVVLAGDGVPAPLRVGECLRIMTGVPLPTGADTVAVREIAREDSGAVEIAPGTAPGANVRAADDDFAAGATALRAGQPAGPAALGVLASFGALTVAVRARPRVAVVVSGDELVPPGASPGPGQRHDSNGSLLPALAIASGAALASVVHAGDDPAVLERALRDAAADADFVLTTGGASAGDADFLPALVARIGERVFWKVAMRPGMPAFFGVVGGAPVFGLPGNPVSVFATFHALVRPALARWLGATALDPPPVAARLAQVVDKRHSRVEFRRARVEVDATATLRVALHPSISSGALRSVLESNALAELAAQPRRWEAGEVVPVHLFGGGFA